LEINFSEPPSPVSCIGSWSSCSADCEKKYNITTARVGNGIDCPYESGEIESCSPGEGECQEVVDETSDDTIEGVNKTLDDTIETTSYSDAGQMASTTTTTTTTTTSPPTPSCSGALRTPICGIQKSSETCNGYTTSNAPNGKGYRCIWNDSRNSCDSYLPGKQNERLCNLETTPGSGGGAVAGEETGGNPVVPAVSPQPTTPGMGEPIWVLAEETNKNCNEVCSSQEGNMKCLSGDWRMDLDEYKQALFDGGLKNEENVNTIEDVETWCGKITTSSGNTRPGTGNTPSRETQCFGTSNNNTDCESRHELSRRLCKCG